MNGAHERLRHAVRRECQRQLREFFQTKDPETGIPLLEVLTAHAALGYGICVGISVRHPEEDGRAVEDPSVTEAESKPASMLEVVRG